MSLLILGVENKICLLDHVLINYWSGKQNIFINVPINSVSGKQNIFT